MDGAKRLRERMRAGKLCVGTGLNLADPSVAELLASAGFDSVWIDMEHGPLGIETVLSHIMVLRGTDTAPLVRVPVNDLNVIKPVLDLAPAGLIVPQVRTVEAVEAAVAACKYPPVGQRGFGPRRALGYGAVSAL